MAKSSWRTAVPTIVIALLLVAGLLLVADSRFRRGATLIAVALALVGVLRLVMPPEQLGPLAVRSKLFDVVFCFGLAGLIGWLVIID